MKQLSIPGTVTGDFSNQSAAIFNLERAQWFYLLDLVCPLDAPNFIPTGRTRNVGDWQAQAQIPRGA